MRRFLAGLVVAGTLLGGAGPAFADHDYDGGGQEYDQWDSDQHNHNRRNRGSFSPGPFDRSPVDAFNGNTVCLPGSTCYADRRDEPPPEER